MKIKVVANNCAWQSLDQKLKDLQGWFAPKIAIDFTVDHVSFKDVPFILYEHVDVIQSQNQGNLYGVDRQWYDDNILLQHGMGYDIVILLMNLDDWKSKGARGWRTDSDQGPIELQVACNENEQMMWPNFPSMNAFFQITRHEILHAMFMLTGQYDMTHYWWEQGKIENARDTLVFDKNPTIGVIARAINFILTKIMKLNMEIQKIPKEEPKLDPQTPVEELSNRQKLFLCAKSFIGVDASPSDVAPDELGCAESVNAIHRKQFGSPIGGDVSTYRLYEALKKHPHFKQTSEALPGDIVISPTGFGGKNGITNGHAGIVGENGKIMSNESKSGNFQENYTMETWRERYGKLGGYPVLFFRRV